MASSIVPEKEKRKKEKEIWRPREQGLIVAPWPSSRANLGILTHLSLHVFGDDKYT